MKMDLFCSSAIFLLASAGLVSCNGENDFDEITTNDNLYKNETITADDLASSILVELKLINSEGKVTTVFSYGENITFDMTLHNISDQTITLAETELLGKDLFRVYTKDEEDLGCPWDVTLVRALYPAPPCSIAAGETRSWSCKWKGLVETSEGLVDSDNLDIPLSEIYNRTLFIQTKERDSLPRGEYYCQFDVYIVGDVRTCRQDFTIE